MIIKKAQHELKKSSGAFFKTNISKGLSHNSVITT